MGSDHDSWRGNAGVGFTVALLVVVGAWFLVDHLGWWAAWPWWGNTLFVLGCIMVLGIGMGSQESSGWKKQLDLPSSEEK